MAALLDPAAAGRLAKVLALTASSIDGEVLAAAKAANRIIEAAGTTWADVLRPTAQADPAVGTRPSERHRPLSVGQKIALARAFPEALTPWEHDFVRGIDGFHTLSPKQMAVLERIILKCKAFSEKHCG
jgi:hypothetical protein